MPGLESIGYLVVGFLLTHIAYRGGQAVLVAMSDSYEHLDYRIQRLLVLPVPFAGLVATYRAVLDATIPAAVFSALVAIAIVVALELRRHNRTPAPVLE